MRQGFLTLGLVLSLTLICLLAVAGQAAETPVAFVSLQYDLIRNGFDTDYIKKVFKDERTEFLPAVVTKIAYLKKEKKADYAHFLRPAVVEKGRRFLAAENTTLTRAVSDFGVAKEVIVAILTVESDLGQITGKYPVFNVFASLAVMDTPEVINDLSLNRRLTGRLQKKAAWGRSELCAFLTYCRQNRIDPLTVKGSWAGAFGFSQFLPSSLLRCGRDGNQDGCINLFCYEDAIFSIANYLKKSGFRLDQRSTWSRAIHAYNHSDAYVDTVLTLAQWY
ncbi:lytic murein transglycosylase [Desulfobacca acetoxidans]|uniref:Membrane-bound lytic murein transglycosylase B n=1 Tax=Desulfobacca acetoxidans (strain ATCC 700848 / DSM 11109 / ASRB2) TaxID=880072 RepID=F2NEI5_DESAR|nr:lytic murein transglycosylase [Desulfobacca acetoxidans]AEB08175.1 Membrane-bound lytic murein transglycosylase B [Desulfobacca acetoxidans DSM 11109]